MLRLGMTLPQFRSEAEPALTAAIEAEQAGLDGVFVFDHLWPLGNPGCPALQSTTLLGALTAETHRISLGTLVARVGLVDDARLVQRFTSLQAMAGKRLVAGLGTGDSANRAENEAYGLPYPPVAERVAHLRACCRALREAGVRTWVGGRSVAVRRAAAEADGWNCWGADVETFAAEGAVVTAMAGPVGPELTWGGQVLIGRDAGEAAEKAARYGDRPGLVRGTVEDLRRHLARLAAAGATWAVCAPLDVGDDPRVSRTLAMATGGSLP